MKGLENVYNMLIECNFFTMILNEKAEETHKNTRNDEHAQEVKRRYFTTQELIVKNANIGKGVTKWNNENKMTIADCYAHDFTDEETALVLGITRRTLANWKKSHKEDFETLNLFKNNMGLKAKRLLHDKMYKFDDALKYLERKQSDDYSTKSVQRHEMVNTLDGKDEIKLLDTLDHEE